MRFVQGFAYGALLTTLGLLAIGYAGVIVDRRRYGR